MEYPSEFLSDLRSLLFLCILILAIRPYRDLAPRLASNYEKA